MHLGREIERHPLRPLGLDDEAILDEDRVLEVLQDVSGCSQSYAADRDEAVQRSSSTGCERRSRPSPSRPPSRAATGSCTAEAADSAAPHRRGGRPRWRRPGSRRCWAPPGARVVVQDVAVDRTLVGDDGPHGVAEQARMDPREVPKSVKFSSWRMASHPRHTARHGRRPSSCPRTPGSPRTRTAAPPWRPRSARSAPRTRTRRLRLARDPRRIGELRDQRADAVAAVLPPCRGA